jgi:hypothetical protein
VIKAGTLWKDQKSYKLNKLLLKYIWISKGSSSTPAPHPKIHRCKRWGKEAERQLPAPLSHSWWSWSSLINQKKKKWNSSWSTHDLGHSCELVLETSELESLPCHISGQSPGLPSIQLVLCALTRLAGHTFQTQLSPLFSDHLRWYFPNCNHHSPVMSWHWPCGSDEACIRTE